MEWFVDLFENWNAFTSGTVILAAALVIPTGIHAVVFHILKRVTARARAPVAASMVEHLRNPVRWIAVVVVVNMSIPVLGMHAEALKLAEHLAAIALIALVAWLVIKCMNVLDDFILMRFDINIADNLRARKIQTQLKMLRRIVIVVVSMLALALILMTFSQVRQLGTSILASAGIAGVIIGFAAQKSLSTFVAGLQIALAQPIRIDDVVIVEGEWGRIEEITLTYVVVKIWDLRRLVLPMNYFIDRPFQNWTRVSAELLGTVYLYLDYRVPVQVIRDKLNEFLEESDYWDHEVSGVQVTNCTERSMEVRALMSAANAPATWNLRCEIREKLVAFLQESYPDALPRVRAEIAGQPEEGRGKAADPGT